MTRKPNRGAPPAPEPDVDEDTLRPGSFAWATEGACIACSARWKEGEGKVSCPHRKEIAEARRRREPAEPVLEEFDPEIGEVFGTTSAAGLPDIGIAWVADGCLLRTSLSIQLERMRKETAVSDRAGSRAETEARAEYYRRSRRLLESLPYQRARDPLWRVPDDPTLTSTSEWEAENGSLLEALTRFFRERVCAADPDAHLVMALWALGASARSDLIDFAPRLLVEAPFGWGKSSTVEALQIVVPRTVYGAAITPAAAHRVMNEHHPVLVVDESAIQDNLELQRVLRAGFKRGARIIRAAQNQDRGVVMIDPFGWVILTTQVDTKDDLVSRCFQLWLAPGAPERRVRQKDPEALKLRTALARLRLDILLGAQYPQIEADSEAAYSQPGLEGRSRDKLSAIWPFALRYGVAEKLCEAAVRLEQDSNRQLAGSDKGLVASALASIVARAGGLSKVRAPDLELVTIQAALEEILIENGECIELGLGDEKTRRVDQKKYGPRDFTARILRELGLRIHYVGHRARLDLVPFVAVWPSIAVRYAGKTTLDEYAERMGVASAFQGGSDVLPTLPQDGVSREGLGSVQGASGSPTISDDESGVVGSVGSVPDGTPAPPPANAGGRPTPVGRTLRASEAPWIVYPDGTVTNRSNGEVVWKPGDDPGKRPRKDGY